MAVTMKCDWESKNGIIIVPKEGLEKILNLLYQFYYKIVIK